MIIYHFFTPKAVPKKLLLVTNLKNLDLLPPVGFFFKNMHRVRNYTPGG
jgi:hypothetical protein